MSYILEGLKKQAQESEDSFTSSNPLHFEDNKIEQESTASAWPYWVAALVLGNVVGLAIWTYVETRFIQSNETRRYT